MSVKGGSRCPQRDGNFKMSVIGTGVDLVECARIQHSIDRFGDRFLHRVFTDGEIEYSMSMKFPARHLAARFAAKEAVSKAFGTGIGKAMGWRDIDIQKKPSGEPFLLLSGPAKELANRVASLLHSSRLAIPSTTRLPVSFLKGCLLSQDRCSEGLSVRMPLTGRDRCNTAS